MFEDIFLRKKVITKKLEEYGFLFDGDFYRLKREIMKGVFSLTITIDQEGHTDTKLIENETGDEYVLYKTDAQGTFVGEVRVAIGEVLNSVVDSGFETSVFKTRQAQMLIDYVGGTYGDKLEFLWTKFPDNAIWRRKDNEKWYGAILTVQRCKLGFNSNETVEIVDLRLQPEKLGALIEKENYYAGWHMNKSNWYTMILDDSVSDRELCDRIRKSYVLAIK